MTVTHRDYSFPEVKKFIEKYGRPDWKVLEIGAGSDRSFRDYFEGLGMSYCAIDPLTPQGVIPSNYYVGFMENLPFVQQFDLVFACHAFEHTEMPVKSLREMKRVLKQGGYVFLITPPHCEHHVLDADEDHINVATEMQLMRFLRYVKLQTVAVYRSELAERKQDHNVITIARKP